MQNQLTAIKTATFQGIITLSQALSLWKRARRDRALTLKAAKLANTPTTSLPTANNEFFVNTSNSAIEFTPRERNIGCV